MSKSNKALVERLFAQHAGSLRAFLGRRAPGSVDELAQEVYARLMRVADADAIRNPESYLYSVAANLVRENRILETRRGFSVDIDDPTIQDELGESSTVVSDIDRERRLLRLREVLVHLPPTSRAAIVMHYWHDLNRDEIAARLNISKRMVKKHLAQGLAQCRLRMKRMG